MIKSFYGLKGISFYKIYLTSTALCGVVTGMTDKDCIENSRKSYGFLAPLLEKLEAHTLKTNIELEKKYDAISLEGDSQFLKKHRNNFRILWQDITAITKNEKKYGVLIYYILEASLCN